MAAGAWRSRIRHSPAGSRKTCPGCGRRLRICPGLSTSWRWDAVDCWRAPLPPTAGCPCDGCARWAHLTTARRSRTTSNLLRFLDGHVAMLACIPAGWRGPRSRACCAWRGSRRWVLPRHCPEWRPGDRQPALRALRHPEFRPAVVHGERAVRAMPAVMPTADRPRRLRRDSQRPGGAERGLPRTGHAGRRTACVSGVRKCTTTTTSRIRTCVRISRSGWPRIV